VIVTDIAASSPFVDEGMAPGDIITELNGQSIDDSESFSEMISETSSGGFLRLYVQRFRGGGQTGFFAFVRKP